MSFALDFQLLRYAIGELEIWVIITWLLMLVVTLMIGWGLRTQNKYYAALVGESQFHTEEKAALFWLAKIRGRAILVLWTAIVLIIIFLDIKQQIDRSQNYLKAEQDSDIAQHQINPYEAVEANPIDEPQKNDDDIYSVSRIEKIKSSYEDAFVSYFILEKCKAIEATEKINISNAMIKNLGDYQHKQELAKIVLTAAKGTYNSLYEDIKCNNALIENTSKNLDLFMKQTKSEAK
jgi:hypothetical protein